MVNVYGDFGGFERFWATKNKAKQNQSRLAPRPVLGVEKTKPIISFGVLCVAYCEKEFEKTNPIYPRRGRMDAGR
jgi:hypothetical protein